MTLCTNANVEEGFLDARLPHRPRMSFFRLGCPRQNILDAAMPGIHRAVFAC
jgi:hypothetical protein